MIIVKLFVTFVSVNIFSVCVASYCEICSNHTICKYIHPGPSPECRLYDSTALLTSKDISELLNKINERRNFVAMGYSKILPQAANMKKITWSPELATFAQRWVDQCDQSVRPDKEDQCRDLENSKVGQNIASVAGPSPGLNVKSFVETWFIQILEYTGSDIYYNESRDCKSKHFTQLIWADTELVGCGKASFYVEEKNTIIERIVCNFAPRGNIHGKPIYTIGYAATQCPNNMIPDNKFKGLCSYKNNGRKLQTRRPPGSSLLRILNLSNNSVKQEQEIDPIRSDLKQIDINSNGSLEQRNQKTRHVFPNNTYSALKRLSPLRKQNFRKSLTNFSSNDDEYLYQQERGHAHVYHGHDTSRINYVTIKDESTNQDFRRYDFSPVPINSYSTNDYRKYHNQYQQCTRRVGAVKNGCTTVACPPNQCTRGITQGCQQSTTCQSTFKETPFTYPVVNHIVPHDLCPCTKQTCPTFPTNCHMNCRYLNTPCRSNNNCFTTPCPRIHRMQENNFNDDTRKSDTYIYDDVIPNIVIRSGTENAKEEIYAPKEIPWPYNQRVDKSFKKTFENTDNTEMQKHNKDLITHPRYQDRDPDFLYRTLDTSARKRRQLDDQAKQFWQLEAKNNKLPQLKSLRYTTIGNKKNRKTRKQTDSMNRFLSTESITIQKGDVTNGREGTQSHATEKFLSFDELMHLRKYNEKYGDYDSRRADNRKAGDATKKTTLETTTKVAARDNSTTKAKGRNKSTKKGLRADAAKTSEITTNTPFERKKYCTRKLTCTWTVFTATGSDGSILAPGGGQLDMGSRTPPGYVDGCTRTSTCTRDYMNRNKMSTLPTEGTDSGMGGDEPLPAPDEDYCERRSLNVQRRSYNNKETTVVINKNQEDKRSTLKDLSSNPVPNSFMDLQTENELETHVCLCSEESIRRKREEQNLLRQSDYDRSKKRFSYGELYYLVLNKIIKERQNNFRENRGCPCNCTNNTEISKSFVFVFIFFVLLP